MNGRMKRYRTKVNKLPEWGAPPITPHVVWGRGEGEGLQSHDTLLIQFRADATRQLSVAFFPLSFGGHAWMVFKWFTWMNVTRSVCSVVWEEEIELIAGAPWFAVVGRYTKRANWSNKSKAITYLRAAVCLMALKCQDRQLATALTCNLLALIERSRKLFCCYIVAIWWEKCFDLHLKGNRCRLSVNVED